MAIWLPPDLSERTEPCDPVARAIEEVFHREQRALNGYAHWKMARLQRAVVEEADDLCQEAMVRMLDGRRPLSDNVELVAQLRGTMRSVASGWYEKSKRACAMHESVRQNARSNDVPDAGEERAQVVVEMLILLLRDDYNALRIVEAVRDGKRPMEIRREFGIDAKAYNAAWQRIRRRAKRAADALIPACRHRTFRSATHRKALL
jgi:DNA-directed RNA polymerase specialized sigma24 family protein